MASVTPDLWLPSQSQGITAYLAGTKLYCLVTEAHVNNFCRAARNSGEAWIRTQVQRPNYLCHLSSLGNQRHHCLPTADHICVVVLAVIAKIMTMILIIAQVS